MSEFLVQEIERFESMTQWDFDVTQQRTLGNDLGDGNGAQGDGWGHGSNYHGENYYYGDGHGDGSGNSLYDPYWGHDHEEYGESFNWLPPACPRRP